MKSLYEGYMSQVPCPDCQGKRLKRESLAVTIQGRSIAELSDLSVRDARAFFEQLYLTEKEQQVITFYYYEELTLKEISEILEVSESRVSQLHTKALKKINVLQMRRPSKRPPILYSTI